MGRILGVKFRDYGQIYYFDSSGLELQIGDRVIVKTEEGVGLGQVAYFPPQAGQDGGQGPVPLLEKLQGAEIKPVLRKATEEDFAQDSLNKALEKEAFSFCLARIKDLGLEMKLVDVEVRFDRSKLIFYFTAPSRVDFRELVKILVSEYRTRIELRQIGVRHEVQILGGVGNCGRVCCCRQFLRKFEPVTIKMAKEQQLFLNPSKISGVCGRLLCCLNFEKYHYADFRKKCPKIGKRFSTPLGELKVLRANLFRDTLVVCADQGQEQEITLFEWAELTMGKGEVTDYEFLFQQEKRVQAVSSGQERITRREYKESVEIFSKMLPEEESGKKGKKAHSQNQQQKVQRKSSKKRPAKRRSRSRKGKKK